MPPPFPPRQEVWLAHAKCLTQLSIELPPFRIVAKRASVVLDVLGKFSSMRSTQDLLKPIECSFEGVEHVAQGVGVTREVFTSLFDALKAEADSAAPGRVFDRAVDGDGGDPVYLPSTRASPQQCEAVGRVLLRLLLMGLPCPLKLAPSLVKSLACSEEELTIDDLAHWDAQLAAQLRGLAAASPLELAAMELSFTELEDPRRVDEPVAASNLRDFVKHKLEHALERSRTDQVTRLVYGFRAIPTLDCVLDLLGARGLDALLISSAVRVLDPLLVARSLEWRDWPVDSMVPALLTQCIMRLDQSRLRRFIRLTTSQNVWPTEGFTPPITIQRCPASEQLPVGSTCFHILRVPDYADPRSVESKLLMALDHVGEQDMGYV
ncbi:hypothetical protein T492DRAFT_848122 [Pavlovales sp. CCMP2436]|nr:hypothetical protein T492DRAFT_848122 [Pavlovales sp. CCMP2436]